MNESHALPSLEALRGNGRNIRLHGNRFIQIDYAGGRIHIWSDLLPTAQVRPAPIHDHDYGFYSRVLSGQLINVTYRIAQTIRWDGDLKLYNEMAYDIWHVDRAAATLVPTDKSCILKVLDMRYNRRGDAYRMWSEQLHATAYIGHAITFCTPEATKVKNVRVMVPHRCLPDNNFSRTDYNERGLWGFVEEIYNGIGKGPLSMQESWEALTRKQSNKRGN
jgi:hypothetical protein